MQCLYKSDYGPIDPGFDPFAGHGRLLSGYEAHVRALSQAQNLGQLEAMERKLQKGEPILWCDQGYGWVYQPEVAGFFEFVLPLLILPWIILRVLPRLKRRASAAVAWTRAGRGPAARSGAP